jgi:P-type Ca2+ transporter type 2C
VRRRNKQMEVSSEELVPGDVVTIESGNKVPADLRLIQASNLAIDEAFLTGESVAATKNIELIDEETPVSDRTNIAYAGATVTSGRGTGLVIATGRHTEVGKIASTLSEEKGGKPPLVLRMEQFSKQISFVVLVFAGLLGFISFLRGMAPNEVVFLIVAMAVSAIPEGLPVAMTVALSLATRRMANRHVIVRKLAAVESLGSCTAIASDKTGTLTVNQQTAKRILFPDGRRVAIEGQGYSDEGDLTLEDGEPVPDDLKEQVLRIVRIGVLVNEASLEKENGNWKHTGDAMDIGLLALGYKADLGPEDVKDRYEVVSEIPFESEQRYAAAFYRTEDGVQAAVKGAVENVLAFCERAIIDGEEQTIDRRHVEQQAQKLAEEGYRVLALAAGPISGNGAGDELGEEQLTGLSLLGLIGFIDPLRPEVKDAVHTAREAGVKVIMITGDHPDTALAISRELNIAQEKDDVCAGYELAEIGSYDVPEFYEQVKHTRVFARVTPQQKLHIVDALIKQGEFVAVTGDGVNDAPALKKANIGVAMGSGTDIAKDTSLLIVTDDNFASIVAGIEEGRFAYDNVRKVTLLLISTGAAELVLLALAVLLNLPVPLLAVQILWLNLVTNGIQDVALAFEAGEEGVMKLPPRKPSEGIFNRKMIEQVLISGTTMAVVCFAVWVYMLNQGWDETTARSTLLTLLVLMQFYHVFNSRSEYRSAFRIPLSKNRVLIFGALAALGIHYLATQVPFLQALLRTEPMPLQTWAGLAALASVVLIVMEIYKRVSKDRSEQAS